MNHKKYITKKEHKKCIKIMNAFSGLIDDDVLILDAGSFGFVKLENYYPPEGFDTVKTFVDSQKLFEDLWDTWLNLQIIKWAQKHGIKEIHFDNIYKILPPEKKKELMAEKNNFAKKAKFQYSKKKLP